MGGWAPESGGVGLGTVGLVDREWKRVQLRWWMEKGSSGRGRAYAVLLVRVWKSGRGELEWGVLLVRVLERREEAGELREGWVVELCRLVVRREVVGTVDWLVVRL